MIISDVTGKTKPYRIHKEQQTKQDMKSGCRGLILKTGKIISRSFSSGGNGKRQVDREVNSLRSLIIQSPPVPVIPVSSPLQITGIH
jgi:hypothetical protein